MLGNDGFLKETRMAEGKLFYEIEYLSVKYGISPAKAEKLIKKYGPIREQVEKHIPH